MQRNGDQDGDPIWQYGNASCLTCIATLAYFKQLGIQKIVWSPYYPILNLIEKVWTERRRYTQEWYYQLYHNHEILSTDTVKNIIRS